MHSTDQESKTIQTYNATAAAWASSHAVVNELAWAAERFHQLLPGGSVLEIGCGGGRDAAELVRLGYDYTGTDASTGMVDVARTTVPGAAFAVCSVYNLPQLHKAFDGFWASAVLLHVPKKRIDEALRAIAAVARPGAIGMITMKDGDNEDFEVRDKNGQHEERLFAYWRKDDFTASLSRNGFQVLDYVYQPVSKRTNWHFFFVQKRK